MNNRQKAKHFKKLYEMMKDTKADRIIFPTEVKRTIKLDVRMTDYQKYINALRKCAKEYENDIIFTEYTDVTALCRDTADLLEELEQEPNKLLNIVFEAIDDCNSDGLTGIFCSYDDGERLKEYIKNKIKSEVE